MLLQTSRHLPADDQQQEERAVRQSDGHSSHAVAPTANDESFAEPGTVLQSSRGPPGNARPH